VRVRERERERERERGGAGGKGRDDVKDDNAEQIDRFLTIDD